MLTTAGRTRRTMAGTTRDPPRWERGSTDAGGSSNPIAITSVTAAVRMNLSITLPLDCLVAPRERMNSASRLCQLRLERQKLPDYREKVGLGGGTGTPSVIVVTRATDSMSTPPVTTSAARDAGMGLLTAMAEQIWTDERWCWPS